MNQLWTIEILANEITFGATQYVWPGDQAALNRLPARLASPGPAFTTPICMDLSTQDPALERRLKKLGIREEDLEEQFIRGTGAGGQKINKTSSTVQLRHPPSGIEVRCQRERQQSANRYWARVELCERLEAQRAAVKLEAQQAREKTRRQTRKRPRGVKEKILQSKHRRSDTKQRRGRVSDKD